MVEFNLNTHKYASWKLLITSWTFALRNTEYLSNFATFRASKSTPDTDSSIITSRTDSYRFASSVFRELLFQTLFQGCIVLNWKFIVFFNAHLLRHGSERDTQKYIFNLDMYFTIWSVQVDTARITHYFVFACIFCILFVLHCDTIR